MSSLIDDSCRFSFEGENAFVAITTPDVGDDSVLYGELAEHVKPLYFEIDSAALKRAFKQERGKPVRFGIRSVGLGITSRFRVEISEDRMICHVILLPPREKEELTHHSLILKELKTRKIVFGINEEEIKNALKYRLFKKRIVAAAGLLPVLGNDGQMKLASRCYMNLMPAVNQSNPEWLFSGFDLLRQVKADDCIAVFLPEKAGKPGMNIMGLPLKTVKGEPIEFKGENIDIRENRVFSKIDGRVVFTDGVLDVERVLKVQPEDKRPVTFVGSVEVMGHVSRMPPIRATGDIVVHGAVEHTSLIAGRNIIIDGNLASTNELAVVAGADFAAKNVSHCSIKAENILLLFSSFQSELLAFRGITTLGANSTVLGGHAQAGRYVISKTFGNERKIPTKVSVATPSIMAQNREQLLAPYMTRVNEIKKKRERVMKRLDQIEDLVSEMFKEEGKAYEKVKEVLNAEIKEFEKKEQLIYKYVVGIKDPKNRDSIGDISANRFYPQVSLYMGHCERQVAEVRDNVRYHLKESSIFTEFFDKKD